MNCHLKKMRRSGGGPSRARLPPDYHPVHISFQLPQTGGEGGSLRAQDVQLGVLLAAGASYQTSHAGVLREVHPHLDSRRNFPLEQKGSLSRGMQKVIVLEYTPLWSSKL